MPKILEDVENRILRSARKRLLGGDLSSFSARGVAEDCGIAVGTIYNYYRDKESLMAAVMAQDWQAELEKAAAEIAGLVAPEEGVLCLHGAIRRFSSLYESVWQSFPTGEGFGSLYRTRHKLLLGQIEDQLAALFRRFDLAVPPGRLTLLSELVIAAGQHPEIGAAELMPFIRGAIPHEI